MNVEDFRNETRAAMEAPIAALSAVASLSPEVRQKLHRLGRQVESYATGVQLDRVGALHGGTRIIASGWACEQRILADGRRQIFSFLLPGDSYRVSSAASFGTRTITALTRVQIADTSELMREDRTGVGFAHAVHRMGSLQAERLFDHIVRLGRQSACERIVHLLLELCNRLRPMGVEKAGQFRVPLTQEVLADALGLSIVHVNRTLQQLRRDKLIELRSGGVTLLKPKALALIAGHDPEESDYSVESARELSLRSEEAARRTLLEGQALMNQGTDFMSDFRANV